MHFFEKLKTVLDSVFGPAKLFVCVEAAHPSTLGRPSDLLLATLLSEDFSVSEGPENEQVEVVLVPDRLSVPPLDGHVLAVGGPRSNVISRIAMEYEIEFQNNPPFYRRYTGVCFPMDYLHIQRPDYQGRLLADMSSLDETARTIIHHYYSILNLQSGSKKKDSGRPSVNLYSVNRHLHRRNNYNMSSLSSSIEFGDKPATDPIMRRRQDDYVIYDHFIETILPNVFSKEFDRHVFLNVHGLRDLGTFAAMYCLQTENYLKGLKKRLKDVQPTWKSDRLKMPVQQGWSVIRPLDKLLGDESQTDALLKKLKHFKRAEPKQFLGQDLIIAPHPDSRAKDATAADNGRQIIKRKRIKRFWKEIENKHYSKDNAGEGRKEGETGSKAKKKGRTNHTVKLAEIDEQQILDAMSLPRDEYFRRHELYALGCFEKKKTVYTQQCRALTLIHALYKAGKIHKGTKVCIVGGGVSGMSAAIAAAETGARVVCVEAEDEVIPIQRSGSHRWLHPFFYDWPAASSDEAFSDLPLADLNWTADASDKVFGKLRKAFWKYKRNKNRKGDQTEFTIYPKFRARMILYDDINGKHIVSKKALNKNKNNEGQFELVDAAPDEPPRRVLDPDSKKEKKAKADRAKWFSDWKKEAELIVREIQDGLRSTDETVPHDIDPNEIVDCDIVIFATGFGVEEPARNLEKAGIHLPRDILLNDGYWDAKNDRIPPTELTKKGNVFVVSGSGDGALLDIMRLCVKQFTDAQWHEKFIRTLNRLILPEKSGAVWSNRRDVLVFADELYRLFQSDSFKLIEGEKNRLEEINRTMTGFDIDFFLDQFDIELNDIQVYNVSLEPQPFWSDSSVAHRLFVWCLYRKGRVRFIRGSIDGFSDGVLTIKRRIGGKKRDIKPKGVIVRHGVGTQKREFLRIQGLLTDENRDENDLAQDAERLVSLLRLSNELHPETVKFFRHTIKHLR